MKSWIRTLFAFLLVFSILGNIESWLIWYVSAENVTGLPPDIRNVSVVLKGKIYTWKNLVIKIVNIINKSVQNLSLEDQERTLQTIDSKLKSVVNTTLDTGLKTTFEYTLWFIEKRIENISNIVSHREEIQTLISDVYTKYTNKSDSNIAHWKSVYDNGSFDVESYKDTFWYLGAKNEAERIAWMKEDTLNRMHLAEKKKQQYISDSKKYSAVVQRAVENFWPYYSKETIQGILDTAIVASAYTQLQAIANVDGMLLVNHIDIDTEKIYQKPTSHSALLVYLGFAKNMLEIQNTDIVANAKFYLNEDQKNYDYKYKYYKGKFPSWDTPTVGTLQSHIDWQKQIYDKKLKTLEDNLSWDDLYLKCLTAANNMSQYYSSPKAQGGFRLIPDGEIIDLMYGFSLLTKGTQDYQLWKLSESQPYVYLHRDDAILFNPWKPHEEDTTDTSWFQLIKDYLDTVGGNIKY